uniref:Centrosomal protein 126 n=1 Tax=Oryzias latipes TaxID=8090 RepID=A0A3P9JSV4_ORYLA
MQVLHEDFFYHSESRLKRDGRLENDRQSLAKEQKLCRSRARKFSQETNRRWKALHERRRQRDMQEERLREEILQQRRQQVQDVTERFQRAHLPPSQKYRQSFRRNAPNIEDALSQIQGSCYTQQSSFLSSSTNIISCTPSPRPLIGGASSRPSLSAVDSYTELLQEQCRRVKHQDASSPEAVLMGVEQISRLSDSISSKDSLEDEDGHHPSFFLHLEKTQAQQNGQSALRSSDQTSCSVMRLINEHIAQSDEAEQGKLQKWPYNDFRVSEASALVEMAPKFQSSLKDFNSLSLYEKNNGGAETFELKSFPGGSIGLTVTDADASGEAASPFSYDSKEALLDFSQQSLNAKQSKSATGILHFSEVGNKDFYFEAPPKSEYFLKGTGDDLPHDKTQEATGRGKTELYGSINNLDKVSNLKSETQKSPNGRSSLHKSLSNIQCDAQKCSDCPDPESEARSACELAFIKGILKKPLKHESGGPPRPSAPGQLIFAKHLAEAIRDSVELARAKAKNMEVSSAVRKKLRWFDEVHLEKEAEGKFMKKQLKVKTHSPAAPQDHQLTPGSNRIPGPSTSYHFTKEAWTDVGVQVNLPQERADEVKVQRSNGWTSGPKVPLRERSTRIGAAPVSSQTRKGTVMRPQYAAEVRHIAKTQGKFRVPRPPPRNNRLEKKSPSGPLDCVCSNQEVVAAERDRKHSEGPFLMYTAVPPPYPQPFSSEGYTESAGHPQTGSSRRGAAGNEKRLCLDSTPTDEEISQLWHGVRCALNTKDVLESGPPVRSPSSEQTPPLQTSQSRKETVVLIGPPSGTTRLHLADIHPGCPPEQNPSSVAMDTAQTHTSGSARRNSRQQELTSISSEERRILLSLDRLNRQLHCGTFLFVTITPPSTVLMSL